MRDFNGEARMKSSATSFNRLRHMDAPMLADQQEVIYINTHTYIYIYIYIYIVFF